MRMLVTEITRDELATYLDAIQRPLPALSGAARDPDVTRQREELLREA